jgi:hypothetical protein
MSYEDIVELLVPELQKRGLMWQDYHVPGRTFGENLHNLPGEPGLNPRHPGSKFKWSNQVSDETKTNGTEVVKTNGTEVVKTNGTEVVKTNGHTVPVVVAA